MDVYCAGVDENGGAVDDVGDGGPVTSAGERALSGLLRNLHAAAPHQLPALFERYAGELGVTDTLVYLADLQQTTLVPFVDASRPVSREAHPLEIEFTEAGRSFQTVEVVAQEGASPAAGIRVWLPLLAGSERLGVLAVTVVDKAALEVRGGLLGDRLRAFASLAAEVIVSKGLHGDNVIRLRRRGEVTLAAEMQWGLLPPLTFACDQVAIAGALEPAYQVAGDSIDYAVDAGYLRFAIFDAMGHDLRSAQLATLAVAAYRNARRSGQTLSQVANSIETVVGHTFSGEAFITAVVAELAIDTGALTWVNGGHPAPLLLRPGKRFAPLRVEPSLPFGLRDGLGGTAPPFVVGTEQLEPGDRVLLYTDGVVEARSPSGRFFGLEQLVQLVTGYLDGGLPATEAVRRLIRSLLEHQQGQLSDDATLLVAEWRSGADRVLEL